MGLTEQAVATGAVALTQPYTIFMVAKSNDTALRIPLSLEKTAGVTGSLIYTNSTASTASLFAGTYLTYAINPVTWNTYDAVFNGASSKVSILGATDTTGDAGTNDVSSYVTIGRHRSNYSDGEAWDGDIAEVMVCMFGPTSDEYGLLQSGDKSSQDALLLSLNFQNNWRYSSRNSYQSRGKTNPQ